MKTYLVLDIGGSAIKYALISENLEILKKSSVPTPLDTLENLIETIGQIYDQFANSILGLAISMPGSIDYNIGFAYNGGALRYIRNISMIEVLKERCPLPITVANDAKCAAFAEIGFGSLKDVDDAITIVLGTGIGGSLIHNKEVIMGKHFFAAEFSYLKTNINEPNNKDEYWCYKNGTIGLLKQVQKELNIHDTLTGKEIFDMANHGHKGVIRAIDHFTQDLVVQIYNLQMIFDPEKIAIGGGISAQPLLFESVQKNMDLLLKSIGLPVPVPQIVPCQFRNDANLIGALYLHLNKKEKV